MGFEKCWRMAFESASCKETKEFCAATWPSKEREGNSHGPRNAHSCCDGDRDMPGLRANRRCDYRDPIRNVNLPLRDLLKTGLALFCSQNVFRAAWQTLAWPLAGGLFAFSRC